MPTCIPQGQHARFLPLRLPEDQGQYRAPCAMVLIRGVQTTAKVTQADGNLRDFQNPSDRPVSPCDTGTHLCTEQPT